ncbi:heavy-metal-associated domain-containing protein [bacterium]|nr:heavy-metal-associated domain-containing protein [bacterium]
MKTETLRIEGMHCNHCVMSVRRELAQVENLQVEDVNIGSAVVQFDTSAVNPEHIDLAVERAGFRVVAHES